MVRSSWITWRLYFLTIPINVLVLIFAADHRLKSWNDVSTWGLVALFSHLTLLPFIAMGVLVSQKTQSWKVDLILLLLLGGIRGLAINYCVAKFNLVLTVTPAYKIFNSMVALPQWFVAFALFIESKRIYQNTFQELFFQAMHKEHLSSNRSTIFPNVNATDELLARLQYLSHNLAQELNKIANRPSDLNQYSIQASKLRDLVDKDIRPATHLLWRKNKIRAPKLPIKKLFTMSILESQLRVPLVMVISIPYLFVGLNGVYGARIALFQSVFILTLDVSLFWISELLFRFSVTSRKQANLLIIFGSFLVALPIQIYLIPESFIMVEDKAILFFYQLLLSTTYVLLLLAANGYKISSEQRMNAIASLEKYLRNEDFQSDFDELSNSQRDEEVARFLHGEFQAGLTASSLLLGEAASSGDTELAKEAIERASGLLNQDLSSISYTRMAPPSTKVKKLIESWKGIADISIDLPSQDLCGEFAFRNAVQIIEEAITNSIRHGKADVIKVKGVLKSEFLIVTVISNGNTMTKGKAGLGTRIFDEVTSDWSHSIEGGRNIFTFTILNK